MERKALGRDLGLSVRMGIALVLLAALYFPILLWLAGFAYFIWGAAVAVLVVLGAIALLAASPYLSERLALSLARVDLGGGEAASRLEPMLERLCGMADVPTPRLGVMPTPVPNAFSAGRTARNGIIVVTEGLVDRLDDAELEAVLAHELVHIANRDAFVMTIAATPALLGRKVLWGFLSLPWTAEGVGAKILSAIAILYLLPVLFVGWLVYALATLLVMSISRYREYVADRGAAILTGAPEQLMSALQKIADEVPLIPAKDLRGASTMNAFFIVSTTTGSDAFEVDPLRMFPTHPPIARRLERLAALARDLGRSRAADELPPPVPAPLAPRRIDNPHAVAAFLLAAIVWGSFAGILIGGLDSAMEFSVWVPLLGSVAVMLGIVLGLQGVGRASAGASGMGYAVAALVFLLGPWALAVFAFVVFAALAVLGLGPVA
jgi:heat shock protein HtpX